MSEEQNNTPSQQVSTENHPKSSKGQTIFSLIVVILFFVGYQVMNTASPATAQKKAEVYVKNSVQATVGTVPAVESKVILKEGDWYLVGVKYALTKEDLKKAHWGRVVKCFRRTGEVHSSTGDLSGANVFKLKKDEMEQVKVFFKLA